MKKLQKEFTTYKIVITCPEKRKQYVSLTFRRKAYLPRGKIQLSTAGQKTQNSVHTRALLLYFFVIDHYCSR